MGFLSKLGKQVRDTRLNPNVGTFAWVTHRLTGIVLALYIFAHSCVISTGRAHGDLFDRVMKSFQNPFVIILEGFLVMVIIWHLLNGLRITIADLLGLTRWHRCMFWIAVILFLGSSAYVWVHLIGEIVAR